MHLFSNTYLFLLLEITETIGVTRERLRALRANDLTIGLVPTMGALHQGHLELIKKSKQTVDSTWVSLFVNPIQFNNPNDLEKYPRNIENDLRMMSEIGVDYAFIPSEKEIYPHPVLLSFDFGDMEHILEGEFRPGHFNGVAIVVSKLFNIVQPDMAFFGLKDLQQVSIIKKMVQDLSFGVKLDVMPTLREKNGLALSSRNERLSVQGKDTAALIFQTLKIGKDELLKSKNWFSIRSELTGKFFNTPELQLEYLELVQTERFTIEEKISEKGTYALCIAAYVEGVRLIDNIMINP